MKEKYKSWLKRFLPVIVGGIGGYAYYYFIGCRTGSCPIQSNPYISTMYGALIGLVFAWPGKKREPDTENSNG
jgi:hypothetical protein